jgi:hypothetical protein
MIFDSWMLRVPGPCRDSHIRTLHNMKHIWSLGKVYGFFFRLREDS